MNNNDYYNNVLYNTLINLSNVNNLSTNNSTNNTSDNIRDFGNYEELESSSESSFRSSLVSINLNRDTYNIKRIRHNKNRPRINNDRYYGALAFDIIWEDDTETREPIQNLINSKNQLVNEHIIDILEDYVRTSRMYPNNNRCCIFCYNKAQNGRFMCSIHNQVYSFLNTRNY